MLTVLKVELTLVPSEVTMVMQATMMSASITAYSTAVGPSSRCRKSTTEFAKRDSMCVSSLVQRRLRRGPLASAPTAPGYVPKACGRPVADGTPARLAVWTTPFGSLAIPKGTGTHGFASHPSGWFAFVVEHGNRSPR